MSDGPFLGISPETYAFWGKSSTDLKQEPLTAKRLAEAFEHIREWEWKPEVELHNPQCPKWVGAQEKQVRMCRCGGAPFEMLFNDDGSTRRDGDP